MEREAPGRRLLGIDTPWNDILKLTEGIHPKRRHGWRRRIQRSISTRLPGRLRSGPLIIYSRGTEAAGFGSSVNIASGKKVGKQAPGPAKKGAGESAKPLRAGTTKRLPMR